MTTDNILCRIRQLRLGILIHSVLYYKMNINLISDYTFDMRAKELRDLQNKYPELSQSVRDYYTAFKDWDGCSGYNLPLEDAWAENKARYLANIWSAYAGVKHRSTIKLKVRR